MKTFSFLTQKGAIGAGPPLHFRRIELKYRLPNRLVPVLVERISPYTQIDPYLAEEAEGRTSYPVTSLYFDTVDLQSLREKDAGLLFRRKLRLRTYRQGFSERTPCFLEVKRRHDAVISKDRLMLSVGQLKPEFVMSDLLDHILQRVEASEDVSEEAHMLRNWLNLRPATLVRYRRIPFVGRQDRRFRITIDTELEGAWRPPYLLNFYHLHPCLLNESIVEIKFNHAVPAWFHNIIRDLELERTSHSKYALVTTSLHPRTLLAHATGDS